MNREQLKRSISKEPNASALARNLGVSQRKLFYWLDKHNIPRRSSTSKGGRTHNAAGYVLVFVGKGAKGSTTQGYVYEHRYVMEKHLDRPLRRNEHVHHRNGDRADNRIDNLEVLTPKKHRQEHQEPDGLRKESSAHRATIYSLVKIGSDINTIVRKVGLSKPTVQKMVFEFGYFTCPICGRDFDVWKALGVHFRRAHPAKYQKVNC